MNQEERAAENTGWEQRIPQFGLKTAVAIVVVISLCFVAIAYVLYINSQFYKYDIARPDVARTEIPISQSASDTTSVVEQADIKKIQELLQLQQQALEPMNDFGPKPVSNQTLGL